MGGGRKGRTGGHVGDQQGVVVVGEEDAVAVRGAPGERRILPGLCGAQLAVQAGDDGGGLDGGELDVDEVVCWEQRGDVLQEVAVGGDGRGGGGEVLAEAQQLAWGGSGVSKGGSCWGGVVGKKQAFWPKGTRVRLGKGGDLGLGCWVMGMHIVKRHVTGRGRESVTGRRRESVTYHARDR